MLAILFVRQILAYVEFEIRKIRTVVGTGEKGYAGDGGPAIECLIGQAYGCAFDINGNLYICDGRNHTVRRIDKVTQVITTVAGTGGAGYSGDGGPATQATVKNLYSLTVDTNGDIYIVDRYNGSNPQSRLRHRHHQHRGRHQGAWLQQRRRSRHTSPDARAQRLLSGRQRRSPYRRYPRPADTPIGPRYRNNDHVCRGRREVNGKPATEASLMGPGGLCGQQRQHLHRRERGQRGPKGRCQRRDVHFCRHRRTWLWRRRRTGIGRRLGRSQSYALRQSRRPDLVDTENKAVRRIDVKTGTVTIIASGHQGGDGGLERPHGCVIDHQGNLYIAEGINHRVRVVGMR